MYSVRQGDVMLVKVDSIPKGLEEKKRDRGLVVLAYGEVTGHMHAFKSDAVTCYSDGAEEEYLEIMEQAYLKHGTINEIKGKSDNKNPDHDGIDLPVGKYRIIRQREYTPEKIRRVQD